MAKLTLNSMVKTILSSMDSDDINNISDTEEALQVVDIIQDAYFELMSQRDWAHLKGLKSLESLGNTSQPTTLKIPDLVSSIEYIKYNITEASDTKKKYRQLTYYEPTVFIDKLLSRNTSDSNVDEVLTGSNIPIWIKNDMQPTFWTSFDDDNVVCDSYNSSDESTLQGSNTITYCVSTPAFLVEDDFVVDMPEKMFPLLLAESKRASHIYLKQQDSSVDAKRALRGLNRMKDKDWRAHSGKTKAKYGRK